MLPTESEKGLNFEIGNGKVLKHIMEGSKCAVKYVCYSGLAHVL